MIRVVYGSGNHHATRIVGEFDCSLEIAFEAAKATLKKINISGTSSQHIDIDIETHSGLGRWGFNATNATWGHYLRTVDHEFKENDTFPLRSQHIIHNIEETLRIEVQKRLYGLDDDIADVLRI